MMATKKVFGLFTVETPSPNFYQLKLSFNREKKLSPPQKMNFHKQYCSSFFSEDPEINLTRFSKSCT